MHARVVSGLKIRESFRTLAEEFSEVSPNESRRIYDLVASASRCLEEAGRNGFLTSIPEFKEAYDRWHQFFGLRSSDHADLPLPSDVSAMLIPTYFFVLLAGERDVAFRVLNTEYAEEGRIWNMEIEAFRKGGLLSIPPNVESHLDLFDLGPDEDAFTEFIRRKRNANYMRDILKEYANVCKVLVDVLEAENDPSMGKPFDEQETMCDVDPPIATMMNSDPISAQAVDNIAGGCMTDDEMALEVAKHFEWCETVEPTRELKAKLKQIQKLVNARAEWIEHRRSNHKSEKELAVIQADILTHWNRNRRDILPMLEVASKMALGHGIDDLPFQDLLGLVTERNLNSELLDASKTAIRETRRLELRNLNQADSSKLARQGVETSRTPSANSEQAKAMVDGLDRLKREFVWFGVRYEWLTETMMDALQVLHKAYREERKVLPEEMENKIGNLPIGGFFKVFEVDRAGWDKVHPVRKIVGGRANSGWYLIEQNSSQT